MSLQERVNPELIKYITSNVFPRYEANGESHGISHITKVIQRSFEIGDEYEESHPDEPPFNADMVYIIAAYHDLGDHVDRRRHHIISGEMMMADTGLDKFITPQEKVIIKEAVEDHRASKKNEPRTIYGRLVLTADRNNELDEFFKRRLRTSSERNPEFSKQEILDEVYDSSKRKFGRDSGYALDKPGYLPSKKLRAHFEALTNLLDDEQEFKRCASEYYNSLYGQDVVEVTNNKPETIRNLITGLVFGDGMTKQAG